jgi:hypothetical protein
MKALAVARLPRVLLVLTAVFALPLACGGGSAGDAKSPPGGAGSAMPADPSAAGLADAGPTTTTTTTLGSGGDLQGTKLQQTTTVASTSGSAAPASSGPHSHDPGRGVADLKAIVAAHRQEARACYDAGVKNHPGIEGDLVVQWTIDPKGNVTQISEDLSRSAITEPGVVACVVKIIQAIQFAPSPGGFETKAFYPFNFRLRQSQQQPSGSP